MHILSLFGIFFLTAQAVFPYAIENSCPGIDVNNVIKHLQALDTIAIQSQGNRAAATQGYQRSVEYILTALAQTDFKVWLQDFTITRFRIIGLPSFFQQEPVVKEFEYLVDFRVMTGSGSGNISTLVTPVLNVGCNGLDFVNFPVGNIALVLRGECTFTDKAKLAEAARASAIIIYNTADNGGGIFSGSADSNIPVLSISHWLGLALIEEGITVKLTLDVKTEKTVSYTTNVLAETLLGDATQVVLIGSHLDSVTGGPGINDNGSGSATNLEMALSIYNCLVQIKNKIRFAWWGAEELGLLGSTYYVNDLAQNNPDELKNIALNINIDMIGSPNYFFGIYNGSGAAEPIRQKCTMIQREFEKVFISQSLPYALTPFDGRSDYGPFIEVGIPAGGLFTGAETVKNSTRRSIFGGLANTPYDPCYHDYCDSIDNISVEALSPMVTAAYTVLTTLANNVELVKAVSNHRNLTSLDKPYTYPKHPEAITMY